MTYEYELELKDLTIKTLKHAHEAYLSGDMISHGERLREAALAIENTRKLGLSPYNPRYIWVDKLTCEWNLVDSFRDVRNPHRLWERYVDCQYPFVKDSWIFNKETRYLPYDCQDVFDFYGVPIGDAESFADDLEHALTLYGNLTNGGGQSISLLYRAGLALRLGDTQKAKMYTIKAQAVCGQWAQDYTTKLMSHISLSCESQNDMIE